jgi:hypothetical protein
VDHKPITDPAELEAISPSELFERVRPLLRKRGLMQNNEELQRIRPNIPSVCAELAAAWESSPRLTEGEVPFADYLAARLCTELRALDRQQHPALYDTHGKFQSDGWPQPLDEETLASTPPAPQDSGAKEPLSIAFRERRAQLANTMRNARIHPASQAALLNNVEQTASGKMSAYLWSKADGLSTLDAKHHPATSAYLATLRYLNGEL